MRNHTEAESKVIKIFESAMNNNPTIEADVLPMIEDISLIPFDFGKDSPSAIVVAMPHRLLINSKLVYTRLHREVKKLFINSVVLFSRNGEIIPIKGHNPNRKREAMIQDLVFPSILAGRMSDVENREEITQEVLLEAKNQCWSKPELSTIEKIMAEMFKAEFRIRVFASAK